MKRLCLLWLVLCALCTAQAQVGIYRSSGFGAIKKEKVQRPKKPLPNAMIGLTGGFGVTVSPHIVYPNAALSFDWAISATPKFAIGMYTHWGIVENFAFGVQLVGGDFMHNKTAFVGGIGFALNTRGSKYNNNEYLKIYDTPNHSSYAWYYKTETIKSGSGTATRTIAYNYEGVAPGLSLRAGIITPKHVYILLGADVFPNMYLGIIDNYRPDGHPWYGASGYSETAATITLSLGYAFGIDPNRKKQSNKEGAL